MNETQLRELLQQRDRAAGHPEPVAVNRATLERRAVRRRNLRTVGAAGFTVVLLFALWQGLGGGWTHDRHIYPTEDLARVARLEAEVSRLRADTESLLAMVANLTTRQREREQLAQIQLSIRQIPAPKQQTRTLVNQAAMTLVERADTLGEQPGQRGTAHELYRQTIQLYPNSDAAQTARRRLQHSQYRQLPEIL